MALKTHPDFWKKALSSSHLRRGRQPCVKPCISDTFLANGAHGRPPRSAVPYTTLSCSDPPRRRTSGGEKAETKIHHSIGKEATGMHGIGRTLDGAERPRATAGRRSPTSDGIEQDLVGEILRERRRQTETARQPAELARRVLGLDHEQTGS